MPSQPYTVSYSQNFEDRIIEAFFPGLKDGFYVDVGANHPFYHSVTKIFYDKGWRGINLEPNPMLFKQIEQNRKRDINLRFGVGDQAGEFDLRVYHSSDGLEGISTLSSSMKQDYLENTNKETEKFSDVKIEVKTLEQIFKKQNVKTINFMKVDVEGFEYEVLKGNNWKKYRPELICIEANHIMKDWRPIVSEAGYSLVFNDGLNDYYLASEAMHRSANFDYAKLFLSNEPIIAFEIYEKIRSLSQAYDESSAQAESLVKELAKCQKWLKTAHSDLAEKNALINEITPLRKHIKRQVKARAAKHLPGSKDL